MASKRTTKAKSGGETKPKRKAQPASDNKYNNFRLAAQRLLKKASPESVKISELAVEKLNELIISFAEKLSYSALTAALHADRITVLDRDIKYATEGFLPAKLYGGLSRYKKAAAKEGRDAKREVGEGKIRKEEQLGINVNVARVRTLMLSVIGQVRLSDKPVRISPLAVDELAITLDAIAYKIAEQAYSESVRDKKKTILERHIEDGMSRDPELAQLLNCRAPIGANIRSTFAPIQPKLSRARSGGAAKKRQPKKKVERSTSEGKAVTKKAKSGGKAKEKRQSSETSGTSSRVASRKPSPARVPSRNPSPVRVPSRKQPRTSPTTPVRTPRGSERGQTNLGADSDATESISESYTQNPTGRLPLGGTRAGPPGSLGGRGTGTGGRGTGRIVRPGGNVL